MSDFGFTPTAVPTPQPHRAAPRAAQPLAAGAAPGGASGAPSGTGGTDGGFAQFILAALTPDTGAQALSLMDLTLPPSGEAAAASTRSAPSGEDEAASKADEGEERAESTPPSTAPDPAALILASLGSGATRTGVPTGPRSSEGTPGAGPSGDIGMDPKTRGRSAAAKPRPDLAAHSTKLTHTDQPDPKAQSTMAQARERAADAPEEPSSAQGSSAGSNTLALRAGEVLKPVVEGSSSSALGASSSGLALPGSGIEPLGADMGSGSAPAVDIHLSPGLDRPEFKSALGVQVAVLVRQGVEQARLQLNPAEMGPVAIRLLKQGQDVRVDLAADLAQTRQVLEQSLPALAQALKEAGFTLSGGGVQAPMATEQGLSSQGGSGPGAQAQGQAMGQAPDDGGRSAARSPAGNPAHTRFGADDHDAEAATLATTHGHRERVVGLVDLYA